MSGLLGIQLKGSDPDALAFQDSILHDFNMGYYNRSTMSPHSSVAFIKMENGFIHPWSIKNVGHQFGYGKMKELIPLRDYLTLPAFLVEDLLTGITDGESLRSKQDKPKEDPGLSKEDREMLELAKKIGLGKA